MEHGHAMLVFPSLSTASMLIPSSPSSVSKPIRFSRISWSTLNLAASVASYQIVPLLSK